MAEPCEVRPIAEPEVAVLDAAYPEHESPPQHHSASSWRVRPPTSSPGRARTRPAGCSWSTPTMHPLARWAVAKEQVRFREQFASAFANPAAAFDFYQQQARQNMAMFEQAMSMWASFGAAASGPRSAKGTEGQPAATTGAAATPATERDELSELKSQLSAMQQKIEKLSRPGPNP